MKIKLIIEAYLKLWANVKDPQNAAYEITSQFIAVAQMEKYKNRVQKGAKSEILVLSILIGLEYYIFCRIDKFFMIMQLSFEDLILKCFD